MYEYFLRYESPYGRSHKKYSIKEQDGKFIIYVKPSWKRGAVYIPCRDGKNWDTKAEAVAELKRLAERYSRSYWVVTHFYKESDEATKTP